MKKVIISTVGTSMLSNLASKDEKSELFYNANCSEIDCSENLKDLINKLEQKSSEMLHNIENEKLRRVSAELNGILGFYDSLSFSDNRDDLHFLITTDTFQGKKSGNILKNILDKKNISAQIVTPTNLTTKTKYNFDEGIKWLLKWCDEILIRYKVSGYEIIFNLTGSFKSLQGYMNTIAMFYADKIIYIFESPQSELIEIPKLPIELNTQNFSDFADKLALASLGYNFKLDEISNLPELLFDRLDEEAFFSVWGELIWSKIKKEILANQLVTFPRISYSDNLKRLFNKASSEEKINFLETIAKASKLLLENDGNLGVLKSDGGLLYEDYKNKSASGKSIGHFRISQSERISCSYSEGELSIRKFGRHDFVNNNP